MNRWIDWESGAEFLRSRVVYKSLDAALTASLRSRQDRQAYLKMLVNRESSNYERVAAGTNLIDTFVPGFARRISARLTDSSRFPFAEAEVELMSYGSGSTVFLLRRPEADRVLKIYRRSLGKKGESLSEIAGHFKTKYETVCSWYNGRFNLVPRAYFLILYGPIFSQPAAAVLQEYIRGNKSDFFLDHSDRELLQLLKRHSDLAERFLFFAEQTLEIQRRFNLCVDFIGQENLMLVEEDGHYRLLVVDNGIFSLELLARTDPDVLERLESRLERVRALRRELS